MFAAYEYWGETRGEVLLGGIRQVLRAARGVQKTWSNLFKKPENRLMRVYVRSGWRTLLVVSAALAIAAGAASPGLALQQAADDLTPGTFLIAPRKAADPSFAGTVVLLVRIDDSGALGLVINGPPM